MRAHLAYGKYVARHKWFVFVAGLRTRAPLWRLLIHDWSKLTPAEWRPYVQSFYGPWGYKDRPAEVVEAFDRAWLHHQHANKHHWQHWVLREDSGATKLLPMPERFVREMVADWMGAGRAITGKWGAAEWYAQNRERILLHDATRERVEALLAPPVPLDPREQDEQSVAGSPPLPDPDCPSCLVLRDHVDRLERELRQTVALALIHAGAEMTEAADNLVPQDIWDDIFARGLAVQKRPLHGEPYSDLTKAGSAALDAALAARAVLSGGGDTRQSEEQGLGDGAERRRSGGAS